MRNGYEVLSEVYLFKEPSAVRNCPSVKPDVEKWMYAVAERDVGWRVVDHFRPPQNVAADWEISVVDGFYFVNVRDGGDVYMAEEAVIYHKTEDQPDVTVHYFAGMAGSDGQLISLTINKGRLPVNACELNFVIRRIQESSSD